MTKDRAFATNPELFVNGPPQVTPPTRGGLDKRATRSRENRDIKSLNFRRQCLKAIDRFRYTTVEMEDIVRTEMQSDLENLLREGARRMLEVALQEEVAEYLREHQEERDKHDRRQVVGNGFHSPLELVTGVGKVLIRQPRVDDRREEERFTSAILPRYARPAPSIDALIPALYLKVSPPRVFQRLLRPFRRQRVRPFCRQHRAAQAGLGQGVCTWRQRDLSGKRYAYVWVDGIYFNVRLQPDRPCVLVVIGATKDGTKEMLAVVDGERES